MNNDVNNNNLNGNTLGNVNNLNNPNPLNNVPPFESNGGVNTNINPVSGVNNINNNGNTGLGDMVHNNATFNNTNPTPQPQPSMSTPAPDVNGTPVANPLFNETLNNNPSPNANPVNMPNDGSIGTMPPLTPETPVAPSVQPMVNPEPTPAYSNPQTLGSGPIPGFESPNNIGTTPPISLEPEKQSKKKSSKLPFIIIIVAVLGAVGFGTYYVLNYTNLINKNTPTITIETKTVEVNLGDDLSQNIDDYATVTGTQSSNCTLALPEQEITKAGNYDFSVTCGGIKKSGTLKVVDNTPLEVELQTVYKTKGDTLDVEEFIKNVDSSYKYEFADEDSVKEILEGEAGTYTVKINVSKNSKKEEVEGTLIITANAVKGYSICSKDVTMSEVEAKVTVSEKISIMDTDTEKNIFGGIAYEIYTFEFSDESEYANYLAKYNTDKKLTINNITGDVEFDNDNKTITITNSVAESDLKSKYGDANIANYSSMRSYFIGEGYTCSYSK